MHTTTPKDNDTLNMPRDKTKLKSIILGKRVWNSLTSEFQKKIITDSNELEMSNKYDGVLLWEYLRRTIMPSTKVEASNLKSDIEAITLKYFDNNVLKYNNWFEKTNKAITVEECKCYNEYLRQLFRAYLNTDPGPFRDTIKSEHQDWIQGKLGDKYTLKKSMVVTRVTHNMVDDQKYDIETKKDIETKDETKKFFLL